MTQTRPNAFTVPEIRRIETRDGEPLFLVVNGATFVEDGVQYVEALATAHDGSEAGPLATVDIITAEVVAPYAIPAGPAPGGSASGRRRASANVAGSWALDGALPSSVLIRSTMSDPRTGDITVDLLLDVPTATRTQDDPPEKDADGRRLLRAGSWNSADTLTTQGGQAMHFAVKNVNVLGTMFSITAKFSTGDTTKSALIPPQTTADFLFTQFGSEPMGWQFDIDSDSDAFIVTWKLFSTWIPGDPPNG